MTIMEKWPVDPEWDKFIQSDAIWPEMDYSDEYQQMLDDSDEIPNHTPITHNYLEEDKPERFCPKCSNRLVPGMLHFLCYHCQTYFKYDDTDILWQSMQDGSYCTFCGSSTHNVPHLGIVCDDAHEVIIPIISATTH